MNMRNRAVAIGLSTVLALGIAAPYASASPQSELAEAADRLESLGGELSELQDSLAQKGEALEKTSYQIGKKEKQLDKTQAELAEARQVLGGRMRSSYKSGTSSLLTVLLGADSLSDVISRIYYMDKVASSDAEAIDEVKALEERLDHEKADLEKTRSKQEKAIGELEAQVSDYEAKVAEAQEYYDALDAEVQAQIAAQKEAEENARIQAALEAAAEKKAQEEAVRKAEEEAAKREEEAAKAQAEQEEAQEQEQQAEEEEPAEETTPEEETTEDEAEEETSSEGTSRAVPGYGGLSTAYAAIGCPYVYGAAGPSSFDCSGLVCYCYGFSRGRTTYAMIDSLKADGVWKTSMSQLNPGDLVFTHEGHVGIYVGGGEMIHAPTPGRSVCQAPVYAFIGGGPF